MAFFFKGIKLPKNGDSLELLEIPTPQRVILPLKQCIGDAANPIVKCGDKVRTGQLIATADTENSLPLYATISGEVTDISERPDHSGKSIPSILITGDGSDTREESATEETDLSALGPTELLKRIHEAGLVIKGLVPVPLSKDLLPIDRPKTLLSLSGREIVKKIDTIIIAACDAEPSLLTNRYLANTHHEELADGIASLKVITGAEKTIFVVDKNNAIPSQILDILTADEEEATKIVRLDTSRYPTGLPIPMVKAVLGREAPLPYGHPRDVGVAIYDIDSVISVGKSVRKHIPQTESLITVGGKALSRHGIAKIRIGMEIGELIESLGGFRQDPAKIVLGGPMMGTAQYDLSVPITKDITGLFALTHDEVQLVGDYRECINCGLCVKACPVNLVPGTLSMYCAKNKFDTAEKYGLFNCIECGCCDYVCPSTRPMVHLFRYAKHQLMECV
jgi:electron transport complex protein RnfC